MERFALGGGIDIYQAAVYRYVDWVLNVPMYFVYRNGVYLNATGMSFKDWMAGKLPLLPGTYPTLDDWEQHLSTVFPEVCRSLQRLLSHVCGREE